MAAKFLKNVYTVANPSNNGWAGVNKQDKTEVENYIKEHLCDEIVKDFTAIKGMWVLKPLFLIYKNAATVINNTITAAQNKNVKELKKCTEDELVSSVLDALKGSDDGKAAAFLQAVFSCLE